MTARGQQQLLLTRAGELDVDRGEDAAFGQLARFSTSSMLPVPLNSSKITWSIRAAGLDERRARGSSASRRASTLRAEPKNFFGFSSTFAPMTAGDRDDRRAPPILAVVGARARRVIESRTGSRHPCPDLDEPMARAAA
jgi:hypothetical protein